MQSKRGMGDQARPPAPPDLEAQFAPMQSTVKWALLGLVIERRGHGYELARRFEAAYDGLLSLGDSYVYKALGTLERRGWIEALPDEQGRGLRKTRYRSTGPGEDAYATHLMEQMANVEDHGRLFFRKLAGLAGHPERALAIVEHGERICARQYAGSHRRSEGAANGPDALAVRLHAEGRRLALTALVTWLEYTRGEIETLGEQGCGDNATA